MESFFLIQDHAVTATAILGCADSMFYVSLGSVMRLLMICAGGQEAVSLNPTCGDS